MYLLFNEIIGNILLLFLNKRIENIFLYTISQIDSYFNKKYNIYLYGSTYFSKDSKAN